MLLGDTPIQSSFQQGIYFRCEHPLEEVWARVARFGTDEYSDNVFSGEGPNWPELREYGAIRVRQSVELRRAASLRSLISSPLPLYYSMLNLTRAALAFVPEVKAHPSHGLGHKAEDDLLDCRANLKLQGTFIDLLASQNGHPPPKASITLGECLARIPELCFDFCSPLRGRSTVAPVTVTSAPARYVELAFDVRSLREASDFEQRWPAMFPHLRDTCSLDRGTTLSVKNAPTLAILSTYTQAVAEFCAKNLLVSLTVQQPGEPAWYAASRTCELDGWPRAAYYLAGMFILSSLVRYEPEALVMFAGSSDSELGWFLTQFLAAAERFYPQLMLSWMLGQTVFFPVA